MGVMNLQVSFETDSENVGDLSKVY